MPGTARSIIIVVVVVVVVVGVVVAVVAVVVAAAAVVVVMRGGFTPAVTGHCQSNRPPTHARAQAHTDIIYIIIYM